MHVHFGFNYLVIALATLAIAAPSTTASAAQPELFLSEPETQASIYFELGSHTISTSGLQTLDALAGQLRKRSWPFELLLTGYNDSSTGDAESLAISVQRIEAVRNALVVRGIPASRIRSIAGGSYEIAVTNHKGDGVKDPLFRKVDVMLSVLE
ncbi:OmpA family protein [Sphingopyxis solisilvae]|uniref:OmpA family protein n=1 Tax=Sphingopyxis solisilvae TaxID=1886788 RepID=UPI001892ADC6|nr:OmpA family protein [Sphingopyxis solisilvae]